MAEGIAIKRDGSSLILSNNLRNPNLVDSGIVGPGTSVAVPNTGTIRAVSCGKPIYRQGGTFYGVGGGGDSFAYYHFADVGLDNTTIGLKVFDPAGNITFATHPNNKPLRVIDAFDNIGHPTDGSGDPDVELGDYSSWVAAGRSLCFAQGLYSGSEEYENFALNTSTGMTDELYWAKINYARAFYWNTTNWKLMATYVRTSPPTSSFTGVGPHVSAPGADTFYDRPMLLVIDVTGY